METKLLCFLLMVWLPTKEMKKQIHNNLAKCLWKALLSNVHCTQSSSVLSIDKPEIKSCDFLPFQHLVSNQEHH
jgi:hypothetical protein